MRRWSGCWPLGGDCENSRVSAAARVGGCFCDAGVELADSRPLKTQSTRFEWGTAWVVRVRLVDVYGHLSWRIFADWLLINCTAIITVQNIALPFLCAF